ncbi:MAG: FkbM family methyltransferase [Opitutales bacterium]|jgi:FkbM family methyltransferase
MKTGLSLRLLRPLLLWGPLRRRLAVAIRLFHFGDLDLSLPLSHGLGAPLALQEDDFSFSEIFFNDVYHEVLAADPLPARWLDLGCHAGYFSLWLEWHRRRRGEPAGSSSALLVDADARRLPGLARLLELNGLAPRWNYTHGAICAGSGAHVFYQRSVMASSAAPYAPEPGHPVSVPILTAAQLLARFPPPYDLIKVDIEGAEVDFLAHYESVWSQARQVLLEWHADSLGSAGVEGLRTRLRDGGFPRLREFGIAPDAASGHLLASRF